MKKWERIGREERRLRKRGAGGGSDYGANLALEAKVAADSGCNSLNHAAVVCDVPRQGVLDSLSLMLKVEAAEDQR